MAPSKPDLMKIGFEGFAMLDEYFARRGKKHQPQPHLPPPPPQQQQYYVMNRHDQYQLPSKPHVYQVIVPVPATVKKEAVFVDCYEAAKFYGGTVVVDYPKTKKPPMRMP